MKALAKTSNYCRNGKNESQLQRDQAKGLAYHLTPEIEEISFNDNDRVLDAGGGVGVYSIILAQQYPNIEFDVCDINSDRLQDGILDAVVAQCENMTFYQSDICQKINADNKSRLRYPEDYCFRLIETSIH